MASAPPPISPFAAEELKQGPLLFSWKNLKHSNLRRFAGPFSSYKSRAYREGFEISYCVLMNGGLLKSVITTLLFEAHRHASRRTLNPISTHVLAGQL
ncbi:hypothetical protein TrVFT333_001492 [Trichoderma virens FT-333]|nr:hypothetical protein TrVFT333_001492 [Trichoderma virens FT-333]